MSTLLGTATAVEDNVLDMMKQAEDAVVRNARLSAERFEPITKLLPRLPYLELMPTPAEVVDHSFGFIDRLTANLRDFSNTVVGLLPVAFEATPVKATKTTPKVQAA